ncbi:MAG TPA: NAD-dependent epimerase/dehydratase family protein [Ilumatobacteraceae bacterium]|jgi:nucleoside-diphosphate-sugar epimerase|nr:NAD-dependent epimerase/dehydratase family protein [Ilumatobacteraceae bacterium]
MHAIVTGAAGFIGSHLSERLIGEGWRVIGIDAFTSYYPRADKEANLAPLRNEARFDLIEADLVDAPLEQIFADRPVVFHLAAQAGVRASFGESFTGYVHDNLIATQRVLEHALDAECPRVAMASSSSVYGDAEEYPCIEGVTPTRPRSPYGATKRMCEDLADIYRGLGLSVTALRYFTVYGPRQRPDMAMRRLCEATIGGAPFTLNGDGLQSRDFTYVGDAVDATLRAGVVLDVPLLLNIGGGEEATMLQVISTIEEIAGKSLDIQIAGDGKGDVRRTAADTRIARHALGWAPSTSLTEGLTTQHAWVRARSLVMAGD